MTAETKDMIKRGIDAAERGNMVEAIHLLENAAKDAKTPMVKSYLAYCLAREHRQLKQAASMCHEAMQLEPNNPVHYLNLGRIYILADQKYRAIQTFRKGLKLGRNARIVAELKNLGLRKPSVFPALSRDNPLNKYLGILSSKLGVR